jgi:muramoyltetrapeptide carboxypeptidase
MKRRKFIQNTGLLALGTTTLSSFSNDLSSGSIKKIIPKALRRGDTIALTAPAGAIFNTTHIEKIEKRLQGLGFKTLRGKTLFEQEGFLAGSDDFRTNELHDLFKNTEINAILSMRGGWGCARILDKLDYDLIKTNPKIIMGYSDITSLLIAITNKTGLITYHGPVGYSSWKDFSTEQVMHTLASGAPFTMQNPSFHLKELATLTSGKATGELIGGNLTVVVSMIGTTHEPDWTNKILFLEETGEEPYRVDRLLWQLKQANVFKKINGVVLGAFSKCEAEEPGRSYSLTEILDQHFKNTNFPVYKGAAFGHIIPKFTLPIGVKTEIDADKFTLKLLEKSVV